VIRRGTRLDAAVGSRKRRRSKPSRARCRVTVRRLIRTLSASGSKGDTGGAPLVLAAHPLDTGRHIAGGGGGMAVKSLPPEDPSPFNPLRPPHRHQGHDPQELAEVST
jgi:hypothetical protein